MNPRPTVFVGSSAEGIHVLEAIQVLLERPCEIVPWTVLFPPGEFALESLERQMDRFDFAIFIMTADDVVTSRGECSFAPRDNLMLEMGLCVGKLGRRRTFLVSDRSEKLKLPSDLAGLNHVTYQPPEGGTLLSALGASCAQLKNTMQSMGRREKPLVAAQ